MTEEIDRTAIVEIGLTKIPRGADHAVVLAACRMWTHTFLTMLEGTKGGGETTDGVVTMKAIEVEMMGSGEMSGATDGVETGGIMKIGIERGDGVGALIGIGIGRERGTGSCTVGDR